jgi:hypothetical protein
VSDEQLEVERLERVAAVDAARLEAESKAAEKREADKLRKRRDRADVKFRKDLKNRQQQGQLEKEQASKQAQKIESERKALLLQELPLFLTEPDEECTDESEQPIPGTSWKAYVREQLELFLYPLEQKEFSSLYWSLAITEVGRLVLDLFDVEYLKLPQGWIWTNTDGELSAAKLPRYAPRYFTWEIESVDVLIAKGQDYDRLNPPNQLPYQIQPRNNPEGIQYGVQQLLAKIEAERAEKKRLYHEKMTRLRSRYIEARKLLNQDFKTPELKIDPPPTPPTPQPEPLAEPVQPRFGGFFESKRSDWPVSQ